MIIRAAITVDDATTKNSLYIPQAEQILNECINEACSKLESRLRIEIPDKVFYISADPA